jgi:hypothetical protein
MLLLIVCRGQQWKPASTTAIDFPKAAKTSEGGTAFPNKTLHESSRAGLGDLRGGCFLVKVIGCSLGMGGCCKDGTVVIL